MTIAIGIRSPGGIVLASDSQMTAGVHKYPEQKIFTIDSEAPSSWSVGLTYAGDPERMRGIYERMMDYLYQDEIIVDSKYVKACFGQCLTDVRASIVDPSYETIDAICALALDFDGLYLFVGKNGIVTEGSDFEILGVGSSSLTKYLKWLFPISRCTANHSYAPALFVAAYIASQASTYVNECGIPLQLCLLRWGFHPELISDTRLEKVTQLVKQWDDLLLQFSIFSSGVELFEGLDHPEGKLMTDAFGGEMAKLRESIEKL